ncbi:class I adenylate-forming enzyme family protein [Mycobacterium sp. MUNTM1]
MGSAPSWIARIHDAHVGNDRPVLYDSAGVISGRQLIGKAATAAEFLVTLGAPTGVAVPALVTTNADSIALLLGGASADRPLAPVGPRLTVDEIAGMAGSCGSPVLLTEHAFADTAREVAHRAGLRAITIPVFASSRNGLPAAVNQAAFVLHTAGTTGTSKQVPISDRVMLGRALILEDLIGFGPTTTFATGSPIHHIGGIGNLLAALTAGGAAAATARFSAEWWSRLSTVGVTHASLVPTMIEMLLSWGILDSVALTTLVYGAAPIRPQTVRRIIDLMPKANVISLFGQTEGSPITCLTAEDHRCATTRPELLKTVGRAVPGLRLRIDNAPDQSVGEVLAAAPHLAVTDSNGWLHTGDLGELDADGYLLLRGRYHDKIVRGGENVFPSEVENILSSHPQIKSIGVVGVPDERLGETIAAFVVPLDAADPPCTSGLHAWARTRMAGFKVPAFWYFVSELPLSSAGKLLRYRLRSAHLEGAGNAR